ncbi:MAG: DUF3307 domain-containing protein [Pseudomonadota bacterium]
MPFDPLVLLTILLGLQAKHFLCDYVLQTQWQIHNKGRYGHPGGLVHSGLHGAGSLVVMGITAASGWASWPIALGLTLADMLLHYHIDWGKMQISKRLDAQPDQLQFWVLIGADQAAHQLTYLGMAYVLVLAHMGVA